MKMWLEFNLYTPVFLPIMSKGIYKRFRFFFLNTFNDQHKLCEFSEFTFLINNTIAKACKVNRILIFCSSFYWMLVNVVHFMWFQWNKKKTPSTLQPCNSARFKNIKYLQKKKNKTKRKPKSHRILKILASKNHFIPTDHIALI